MHGRHAKHPGRGSSRELLGHALGKGEPVAMLLHARRVLQPLRRPRPKWRMWARLRLRGRLLPRAWVSLMALRAKEAHPHSWTHCSRGRALRKMGRLSSCCCMPGTGCIPWLWNFDKWIRHVHGPAQPSLRCRLQIPFAP